MILTLIVGAVFLFGAGFAFGLVVVNSEPTSYDRVKAFHKAFGHPVGKSAALLDDGRTQLRVALIQEELDEYKEAVSAGDLVGAADALGDLDYVVNGAAIEHGFNLPVITAEIHRSNMTKLGPDGKPIYREDGKILKGKDYEPPKLGGLLV
jgi:predicted HAD superfamily Cof-like phosphohydrolase